MNLYTEFFTVTCRRHMSLLEPHPYKMMVIDSLSHLVRRQEVELHAYVIMRNHFHLLWTVARKSNVQQRMMSFLGKEMMKKLQIDYPHLLSLYKVEASDRAYNFFHPSYRVMLHTQKAIDDVAAYIHANPVKAGIHSVMQPYIYCSDRFYTEGIDPFGIIKSFKGDHLTR